MTTLSVLIPTRDRRRYLTEALASARTQLDVDLEILVSDDGSTDGTMDLIRSVALEDPRVRPVPRNPTPGLFENVRHLILQASGELFTVFGDDDLLDPDFARLLCGPMLDDPEVNLAFTDHRVIDADGTVLPRATAASSRRFGRASLPAGRLADPASVALEHGIWLGFTVYRTSVFAPEPFDPACGPAADWDFAIRAALRGPIIFVPGRHASYRDHGGTASRAARLTASKGAVAVLQKHRFVDPVLEHRRLEMLRDAQKRLAFQAAARDPDLSRRAASAYRSMGGPTSPHTVAAAVIRVMPGPLSGWLNDVVQWTLRSARGLARSLAP